MYEKLCEFLREHAMKIINLKNEKSSRNHMKMQKSVIFVKRNLKKKYFKEKKVRDHCHYTGNYRGAALSLCNLKCSVLKTSLIVFHNGSNYDYHLS